MESWLLQRLDVGSSRLAEVEALRPAFGSWLHEAPPDPGLATDIFDWMNRYLHKVMPVNENLQCTNVLNLLGASLQPNVDNNEVASEGALLRILAYSVAWGLGGLLEPQSCAVFHAKVAEVLASRASDVAPPCEPDETIFEYVPDLSSLQTRQWKRWAPMDWQAPKQMSCSAMLIPTGDSVRAEFMIDIVAMLYIHGHALHPEVLLGLHAR